MSTYLSESALSAKESLKSFINTFNPYIEEFLSTKSKFAKTNYDSDCAYALDVFKDIATRDAKRLRASFVHSAYKMLGGNETKLAMELGVAIEIFHAYLLVVDDFMDMSETRRGGPTAHKIFNHPKFKIRARNKKFLDHLGESLAVDTSLIALHAGMNIVSSLNTDDSIKIKLLQNINLRLEITGYGQFIDVINTAKKKVSEHEVIKMLEYKTGVYTFENPLHSGAILAGKTDIKTLEAISKYAIPAGIAFQIQDDILGMFGVTDVTGKSNMDDLMEGKYTLLINKAIELGNKTQQKTLYTYLGNRKINAKDHEDAKNIILETGSFDYSKKMAKELADIAKEALISNKTSEWDNNEIKYLIGIADYVIERES